jgi:hypothetical protein
MGADQETCTKSEAKYIALFLSYVLGFLNTLSDSKSRGATWRIVGLVAMARWFVFETPY